MARELVDIEQEMLNEKATHSELDVLDTPSGTGIWRKLISVVAKGIRSMEELWDAFKADLIEIGEQQKYGTVPYYRGKALAYGGGAIVSRVSVREGRKVVIVKTAKNGGSGTIVHLTDAELEGLRNEFKTDSKVAGTDLIVLSQTADLCDFKISVRFTGDQATVETAVQTALKDYLSTLYDVELSKTLVEQELLKVDGVEDVFITELKVNRGLGYVLITNNSVDADAGYFAVGQSGGNDLITLSMYQ
ncbi:MAG: hypothetical protein R2800_09810 [Flavipsychrobacter sp.]